MDIQQFEDLLQGYYGGSLAVQDQEQRTQKKKSQKDAANFTASGVATRQTIERYSEVIQQDIQMFERLKYGSLQGSPIQKHGDAAEVLGVRDYNKEQILKGSDKRMFLSESKTDDVTDVLIKDKSGNVLKGQAKYNSEARLTMKDLSQQKYTANDLKFAPPEQVEEIKRLAKEEAQKLRAQARQLRQQGQTDLAKQKVQEAKNYEHTADTVQGFKRSRDEAKAASRNETSRVKVTAKDIMKDSHEAGVAGAKVGAAISGGVSGAQNFHAAIKGDKEIGEAIVDTAIDTAKGAAMSYAVTYSSTAIKAGAQKAGEKLGSKALTAFSKSAKGPALFVTSTIEVGKSFKKYLDGDLGSTELFVELGEKGTGILCGEVGAVVGEVAGVAIGTSLGALVGTAILPGLGSVAGAQAGAAIGAVIGPIIGSMVGYMVGTQVYQSVKSLIEGGYNSEKLRRMKAIYEQAYKRMKKERLEMERQIELHFADRHDFFRDCFKSMEKAVLQNDIDGINGQLSNIVGAFGETLQFKNFKEFDDFMMDDSTILKL